MLLIGIVCISMCISMFPAGTILVDLICRVMQMQSPVLRNDRTKRKVTHVPHICQTPPHCAMLEADRLACWRCESCVLQMRQI